jgi:hypothetical protein
MTDVALMVVVLGTVTLALAAISLAVLGWLRRRAR